MTINTFFGESFHWVCYLMPTNRHCLAHHRSKKQIQRLENSCPVNGDYHHRLLWSHLKETNHRSLEQLARQDADRPYNSHAAAYFPRRQQNNRLNWMRPYFGDHHFPLPMNHLRWADNNRTELVRAIRLSSGFCSRKDSDWIPPSIEPRNDSLSHLLRFTQLKWKSIVRLRQNKFLQQFVPGFCGWKYSLAGCETGSCCQCLSLKMHGKRSTTKPQNIRSFIWNCFHF